MQEKNCFQCDRPIHFSVSETTLKCGKCGAINENVKSEPSELSLKRKSGKKTDDDIALLAGIGIGLAYLEKDD